MYPNFDQVESVVKTHKSELSNEDEFVGFSILIQDVKNNQADFMNEFFHGLDDIEKLRLRDVLNTRRHKNKERELVRRIVKLKRKIK